MREDGLEAYICDAWNVSDILRIAAQLLINTRFFLRDPGVGFLAWTSRGCVLNGTLGDPLTKDFLANWDGTSLTGEACYYPRDLIALQALVGILFSFRLLYFFRANLTFAALVHTIFKIAREIYPFLVMMLVILLGFSYSLFVLLQHSHDFDNVDEMWSNPWLFFQASWGLGLHGESISENTQHLVQARMEISFVYYLFQFIIQASLPWDRALLP
eukprot:7378877-Prymnesium_polylepis.3